MSRPLRIQYPGAWYHIMNRGLGRTAIFSDAEDRKLFFKTLEEAIKLWKIRVHAYSLMDNHYHLLIETPLGNLSRAMRAINGVYTQRFNRRHKQDGPLMRGRFKSILVDRDSYLLELIRYIHLNGVRAFQYRSPKEDPYTSHRAYLQFHPFSSWLTTEVVLSQFHSNPTQARKRFDQFVSEGVSEELRKTLASKKWPAILGSKAFIGRIRDKHLSGKKRFIEIPQAKGLLITQEPGEVLRKVSQAYRTDIKKITARSSAKRNPARQAAMILLRYACRLSYAKIGEILGGVSYGAVAPVCLRAGKRAERLCAEVLGKYKI